MPTCQTNRSHLCFEELVAILRNLQECTFSSVVFSRAFDLIIVFLLNQNEHQQQSTNMEAQRFANAALVLLSAVLPGVLSVHLVSPESSLYV
jgi:hypothetical protein